MNIRQLLASTLIFLFSDVVPLSGQDTAFVLHDATPVRLRINRNLSSADAAIGETVDFEVLDEVKVGETVIVARGATAIATVTEAQKKRRMGRGGKIDVNIDYVRAINDDKIALRAVKRLSGGGHVGAMTGAIVATSLLFWPAAPFFLFMHGKDITIPKGTEITAYTNGDIRLDPIRFGAKPVVLAPVPVLSAPGLAVPAPSLAGPIPTIATSAAITQTPAPPDQADPVQTPSAGTPTIAAPQLTHAALGTPAPAATASPASVAATPLSAAFKAKGSPPPKFAEVTNNRPMQSDEEAAAIVMLPGDPSHKLVNADIIALKQAGFGDGVIISKINASAANYKLDIKDLVDLKKANISDAVISAMIEAAKR
jgi:hypothetical protein